MSETKRCPQCQAEIPPAAPEGLCPQCLLQAGLEPKTAEGEPKTAAYSPSGSGFVPPTPEALQPAFPQLEILELVGKGGMGAVYKAKQRGLDRLVAVKILPPEVSQDPAFAERFTREARALAMLNHPNIVGIYDSGHAGGYYYFVMEYVDGVNLRQAMRAGTLKSAEALKIVPQICEALQFAHDEGIVHRDIKPENILLDKKGRVKIADFGLAKLLGRTAADVSLTGTQQVMGTMHYMAPEQLEGSRDVDHRADIYSLGVTFYEMLTGELPIGRFAAPSKKVQIDVRLDEVVLRSLEKAPEQRYQHASEIKTDMETIASGPVAEAAGASTPELEAPISVPYSHFGSGFLDLGGFGVLHFDGASLEFEFTHWGWFSTTRAASVQIPLSEVKSLWVEKGEFFSSLCLRTHRWRTLDDLPFSSHMQVALAIEPKHLAAAQELQSAVLRALQRSPQASEIKTEVEGIVSTPATPFAAAGADADARLGMGCATVFFLVLGVFSIVFAAVNGGADVGRERAGLICGGVSFLGLAVTIFSIVRHRRRQAAQPSAATNDADVSPASHHAIWPRVATIAVCLLVAVVGLVPIVHRDTPIWGLRGFCDETGFQVMQVWPGSPAEWVGLRTGDRIEAVNGYSLKKEGDHLTTVGLRMLLSTGVNQKATLTVRRGPPMDIYGQDPPVATVYYQDYWHPIAGCVGLLLGAFALAAGGMAPSRRGMIVLGTGLVIGAGFFVVVVAQPQSNDWPTVDLYRSDATLILAGLDHSPDLHWQTYLGLAASIALIALGVVERLTAGRSRRMSASAPKPSTTPSGVGARTSYLRAVVLPFVALSAFLIAAAGGCFAVLRPTEDTKIALGNPQVLADRYGGIERVRIETWVALGNPSDPAALFAILATLGLVFLLVLLNGIWLCRRFVFNASTSSAVGGSNDSATTDDHTGPPPHADDPLEQLVIDGWYPGRKIAAIVAYREKTGADLAEAKAAVEKIAEKYRLPGRKTKAKLGHVLILIGAGVLLTLILLSPLVYAAGVAAAISVQLLLFGVGATAGILAFHAVWKEWWQSPSPFVWKVIRSGLLLASVLCLWCFLSSSTTGTSDGVLRFEIGSPSPWLRFCPVPGEGLQISPVSWPTLILIGGWLAFWAYRQSLAGAKQVLEKSPEQPSGARPVGADEVVLRSLAKEPELRYQHASEIKTKVEGSVSTPAPAAVTAPAAEDPEKAYFALPPRQRVLANYYLNVVGYDLEKALAALAAMDELELAVLENLLHKITAVKIYRKKTGAGLADAKAAVEAIAKKHGVEFQPVPAGAYVAAAMIFVGCLAALGMCVWVYQGLSPIIAIPLMLLLASPSMVSAWKKWGTPDGYQFAALAIVILFTPVVFPLTTFMADPEPTLNHLYALTGVTRGPHDAWFCQNLLWGGLFCLLIWLVWFLRKSIDERRAAAKKQKNPELPAVTHRVGAPPVNRPWMVPVLGLVNVLVGVIMLFLAASSFLYPDRLPADAALRPIYDVWVIAEPIVDYATAALWFAAGIGLILWQPWARRLTVALAWIQLIVFVVTIPFVIAFEMQPAFAQADKAVAPNEQAISFFFLVAIFGGSILTLLAYLIAVLIYFTRPRIIAAFGPRDEQPAANV